VFFLPVNIKYPNLKV